MRCPGPDRHRDMPLLLPGLIRNAASARCARMQGNTEILSTNRRRCRRKFAVPPPENESRRKVPSLRSEERDIVVGGEYAVPYARVNKQSSWRRNYGMCAVAFCLCCCASLPFTPDGTQCLPEHSRRQPVSSQIPYSHTEGARGEEA